MPTYQYRCVKCGKTFDRVESMAEHGKKKPACPGCGSRKTEPLLSAFFAKTARKS